MNRALFSALLIFTTAGLFTGCYTQLASSGDYYGYTGRVRRPRLVESDTIRSASPEAIAQANAAPKYDTIMKGDTMFIEERATTVERTRADYSSNLTEPNGTQPNDAAETIINNYYGGGAPTDYWYDGYAPRPHAVISLSFGWPYWGYHSWYSPWYSYGYYPSWYDGFYGYDYGYPGFYPPMYDAFYSPYGYYGGYYGGYRGFGYGGGYGYRGGYAGGYGRVPHYGRIMTGEQHHLVMAENGGIPQSIAPANRTMPQTNSQFAGAQSNGMQAARAPIVIHRMAGGGQSASVPMNENGTMSRSEATRSEQPLSEASRSEEARGEEAASISATDRNSPIHSVAPGTNGTVRFASETGAKQASTATAAETRSEVSAAQAATGSHHIVVVRRSAGSSGSYGQSYRSSYGGGNYRGGNAGGGSYRGSNAGGGYRTGGNAGGVVRSGGGNAGGGNAGGGNAGGGNAGGGRSGGGGGGSSRSSGGGGGGRSK